MSSSSCHWKSAVDPRTGRTYYYHEITRETQWRKPMELASDEEKRKMEAKEKKQKDFFAAMEANILNSLSQGVVPGTPSQPEVLRKKSSRKPTVDDDRPDLVRTISTMDESVLSNLIRRQPSFRSIKKRGPNSLLVSDLTISKQGSARRDGFDSIVKDNQSHLDPLAESGLEGNESLPELFSYLPDEDPGVDYSSDDCSLDMGLSAAMSARSDAGKFNESSLTGFGLTWEETQALKKLASITKEMMDADDDDVDVGTEFESGKFKASAGATPSWKSKDSKGMRDLPREIEFDDDSDSESEVPNKGASYSGTPFQKAKDMGGGRALPRELDFEDSDDESDPGEGRKAPAEEKSTKPAETDEEKRPEVKRRNTCGTLYVGTTMSAPDKDATIKCVCGVIRTHILSSQKDSSYSPKTSAYKVFNDLESQQGGIQSEFHNNDAMEPVPSLEDVTKFYRGIFFKAQMETDCIIMSLIYVERLIKRTAGKLRPRASNWRSLLFSCMILSSKVWDDLSMWNADFSQSCPPGVSFPLQRINQLEVAVLNALNFQVKVPASEYAKYYFLLRSMLIKSGLGGDESSMTPLDVMGARRLQHVSSQFESLSLTKSSALSKRSQSLNIFSTKSKQRESLNASKVGLEHVVKM